MILESSTVTFIKSEIATLFGEFGKCKKVELARRGNCFLPKKSEKNWGFGLMQELSTKSKKVDLWLNPFQTLKK